MATLVPPSVKDIRAYLRKRTHMPCSVKGCTHYATDALVAYVPNRGYVVSYYCVECADKYVTNLPQYAIDHSITIHSRVSVD